MRTGGCVMLALSFTALQSVLGSGSVYLINWTDASVDHVAALPEVRLRIGSLLIPPR
jgi:hypothetical protein